MGLEAVGICQLGLPVFIFQITIRTFDNCIPSILLINLIFAPILLLTSLLNYFFLGSDNSLNKRILRLQVSAPFIPIIVLRHVCLPVSLLGPNDLLLVLRALGLRLLILETVILPEYLVKLLFILVLWQDLQVDDG